MGYPTRESFLAPAYAINAASALPSSFTRLNRSAALGNNSAARSRDAVLAAARFSPRGNPARAFQAVGAMGMMDSPAAMAAASATPAACPNANCPDWPGIPLTFSKYISETPAAANRRASATVAATSGRARHVPPTRTRTTGAGKTRIVSRNGS